jgi:hypothetical protein
MIYRRKKEKIQAAMEFFPEVLMSVQQAAESHTLALNKWKATFGSSSDSD